MTAPNATPSTITHLHAAWARRAPRERMLIGLAALVLGLGLLWWLALAPALTTLRQAEPRQRALDAEWQRVQRLQAEAQALKASPRIGHDEALRALEGSVRQRLGPSAQLTVLSDRATVTLKDTPAQPLAAWLAEVRVSARAVPLEARLTRSPGAAAPPPAEAGTGTRWNGTLSLALPAP